MSDAEVAALARFLPLIEGVPRGIFFGSAPRAAHPVGAARAGLVVRVARDQVDMQVRNGLAGRGAVVDGDVVGGGLQFSCQGILCGVE